MALGEAASVMGKRDKRERRRVARQDEASAREAQRREQLRAEILAQSCPSCGGSTVARIQYGLPALDDEMKADIAAGIIVLAGSSFASDSPVWVCGNCKREWGRLFPEQIA